MQRQLYLFIYILLLLLLPAIGYAAELHGPYAAVRDKNILVSASVSLSPERAEEVRKGVEKEIIFYVSLFRVWDNWPDEFMLGKKIEQVLKCDPVKNENIATSTIETVTRKKRFSSCDEMMDWALSLRAVELYDIDLLEESEYFIRVSVESRIRELPPFINLILFFVRETEFKIESDSPSFPLRFE